MSNLAWGRIGISNFKQYMVWGITDSVLSAAASALAASISALVLLFLFFGAASFSEILPARTFLSFSDSYVISSFWIVSAFLLFLFFGAASTLSAASNFFEADFFGFEIGLAISSFFFLAKFLTAICWKSGTYDFKTKWFIIIIFCAFLRPFLCTRILCALNPALNILFDCFLI